jgi:hypothetical protein
MTALPTARLHGLEVDCVRSPRRPGGRHAHPLRARNGLAQPRTVPRVSRCRASLRGHAAARQHSAQAACRAAARPVAAPRRAGSGSPGTPSSRTRCRRSDSPYPVQRAVLITVKHIVILSLAKPTCTLLHTRCGRTTDGATRRGARTSENAFRFMLSCLAHVMRLIDDTVQPSVMDCDLTRCGDGELQSCNRTETHGEAKRTRKEPYSSARQHECCHQDPASGSDPALRARCRGPMRRLPIGPEPAAPAILIETFTCILTINNQNMAICQRNNYLMINLTV